MKSILLYNLKGGSGKTSLIMAMAKIMSSNSKILLVDVDPQANATITCGGDPSLTTGLDPVEEPGTPIYGCINNIRLENGLPVKNFISKTTFRHIDIIASGYELYKLRRDIEDAYNEGNNIFAKLIEDVRTQCKYDYIMFDTNPYPGADVVSLLEAVDFLVMPTINDTYSSYGSIKVMDFIEEANKHRKSELDYFVVRSHYNKKRNSTNETYDEGLEDLFGDHLLKAKIPYSNIPSGAQDTGINSDSKMAYITAVKLITKTVVKRIGK